MGSRPSTSISPGEDRGSRSRTAHPNVGDQISNEVAGPEESTLGYEDYQERREWPGYNPRLAVPYDPDWLANAMGVTNASHGDDHPADILGHDYAFDDEDPSRLGAEAAYCRAAADSHADSCTPDDPDSAEAGSTPFKGQGSVMYSYRESSKMRIGTLNVKGSLQGASGVHLNVKFCTVCSINVSWSISIHASLCIYFFQGTHSWLTS